MRAAEENVNHPNWSGVVLLFTLAAVVIAGISLWVFRNCWLALILSTILFYGGAVGVCSTFKLKSRLEIKRGNAMQCISLGAALAFLLGFFIAWSGSLFFKKALTPDSLQFMSRQVRSSGAWRYGSVPFLLWISMVLPIGEEMYWRGGLQGILRARYGFGTTVFLSTLCFSIYHLGTISFFLPSFAAAPFVVSVFLGGLIFGWLTEYTGNIWAAAICHGPGAWGGTFYLLNKFLS